MTTPIAARAGPALRLLEHEARALLTRLARLKPFVLHEPMVPAAALSMPAQAAIESQLARARRELRRRVRGFLRWVTGPVAARAGAPQAQRHFTLLRLRFNAVLSQTDMFGDVITQRSESSTGVWLAGLDIVAADALRVAGMPAALPPVICYLDRGHGAAIRRARTRLPGGGSNPVAIVRVPRERMVGSGIASSLVHEVGHQGAEMLGLVGSLRPVLQGMQRQGGDAGEAWRLWEAWISEIVADLWSVGVVGIAAPMGLIGVVSLPRVFVFRAEASDPHPMPWVRVRLSCAMGNALQPHPQWAALSRTWATLYPLEREAAGTRDLIALLERTMPAFVTLLAQHRPRALSGRSLGETFGGAERRPEALAARYRQWCATPALMRRTRPALAMAVIGQAKADGVLSPERESALLGDLLTYWAMQDALRAAGVREASAGMTERGLRLLA